MKAIVIHQPWAWAILAGIKRYENRTWRTTHRGALAIVAGRSRASLGLEGDLLPGLPGVADLPFGAIVGVVEVVDVWPVALCGKDPFATGPWCWVLERAEAVGPIPWRGEQGLFEVPDEVIRRAARRTGIGP